MRAFCYVMDEGLYRIKHLAWRSCAESPETESPALGRAWGFCASYAGSGCRLAPLPYEENRCSQRRLPKAVEVVTLCPLRGRFNRRAINTCSCYSDQVACPGHTLLTPQKHLSVPSGLGFRFDLTIVVRGRPSERLGIIGGLVGCLPLLPPYDFHSPRIQNHATPTRADLLMR